MAAVGLTWAECKEMCPSDIAPACHNAIDTVTVSGPKASIEKFVEELKEKKIFAKEVACNQVAFHSHYMMEIAPLLKKCLENVIRNPPKQRSSRWISSSVPENRWNTPLALTSSPDYHVNNLCSPVLFQEALQNIPSNAITIELAPHCLLLAIIKRSLSTDCVHLSLMKRGTHDHVNYFYTNLGKLYNEGVNINIMSNYESIQYPVPVNVPFISPLIASQWDHSQQWKIPTFEMFTQSLGSAQQAKHEIDLNDGSEYSFIIGHQIDGRCLFPATGYLILVWKTFAKLNNYEDYQQMSVLFEQVQIHRATICSLTNKVIFYVNILPTNGTFEIIENNTIIVTGKISLSEQLTMQKFHRKIQLNSNEKYLQTNEIYRDFNLRGYEYSGLFRGINQITIDGIYGELKWNNDWISYLDTMLQVHLIPTQGLQLPTRIDSLRINPKLHLESVSSSTCSVYVDYWNSLCFSGGIELFGLHCTGTSKKNKQQNTILESYLYVPFNNEENLTNELETCLYLILENSLTTTLSLCQIGNEKLSENIWNFYSQQPSIKSLEYTLVTSLLSDEINKKINLIENLSSITTSVDFIFVNQIEDWEKLFSICKSNGFILFSSDIDIPMNQLQTANFVQIAKRKNYQLWKKLSNENYNDIIVNLDEKNFQWIEQIKTLLSNSSSQRVWLVSNQLDNGILGFFNCLRREPGGQSFR
jgi:fatty acid synthase